MENPYKIQNFYNRWDIDFNDEDGWGQFRKRVTNSLGVFQFTIHSSEAEEDFFDFIGELYEPLPFVIFKNPLGKVSDSKIYSQFLNEQDNLYFHCKSILD